MRLPFTKKKEKLAIEQVIFFDIYSLMLSDFIEIVVNERFELIVKSGKPSKEEIALKWDELLLKYSDLIGTTEYDAAINEEKEIIQLRGNINLVSSILKTLTELFVPEFAEILFDWFDLTIEYFEDPETYYKQFIKIEARLKLWKVEMDLLLLKSPKSKEGQKIDRETFDNIKIELSSFMGYPIRENDTTVSEFALMIKRLRKHNEAVERSLQQQKKVA